MKYFIITLTLFLSFKIFSQDTLRKNVLRGGTALFPLPNKPMIGFRSNSHKNWAFDTKLGYNFSRIPLLNLEFNLLRRHIKNELFNMYSGFGVTLDGITPGIIVPLGFEIIPFSNFKNIVFIAEASPKVTFSFSSAFNSSFSGNIGIIYYRPQKQKK